MRSTTKPKSASTGDYEVGYGKPPKEHQFRSDEIHNPDGRSRRPESTFAEILRRVLAEVETIEINGEKHRKTNATIIAMALRQKAIEGDRMARRLLTQLYKEFDRELTQEQNQIQSGVRHLSRDYPRVVEEEFEKLRQNEPDGNEDEQRQTAEERALVKSLKVPKPVRPLKLIKRRGGREPRPAAGILRANPQRRP